MSRSSEGRLEDVDGMMTQPQAAYRIAVAEACINCDMRSMCAITCRAFVSTPVLPSGRWGEGDRNCSSDVAVIHHPRMHMAIHTEPLNRTVSGIGRKVSIQHEIVVLYYVFLRQKLGKFRYLSQPPRVFMNTMCDMLQKTCFRDSTRHKHHNVQRERKLVYATILHAEV